MARMFIFLLCGLSILLLAWPALAGDQPTASLRPLNALVGNWKGTGPDGKAARISYRFTSGGSSLTETLSHEKKPGMTTMYHVDGNRLMLTHYCSLNNQPRMKADTYKEGDKALTFSFVDATNLASPADMHMHKVTFEFKDRDHFVQTWVAMKDGKELPPHVFQFERVK